MKASKPLSAEEQQAAKEFFAKNPWIGKTHTAKLAEPVHEEAPSQRESHVA